MIGREARQTDTDGHRVLCNVFSCCFLTLITSQFLAALMVLYSRAQHATPALCQDGRLANATDSSRSLVYIDVPAGGVVEIECLVPVAVYDTRQLHEPRDNLRQIGVQGPLDIPFEYINSGVTCMHHNASIFDHFNDMLALQFHKHCETDTWACAHGECTSNEKALRMCLSKLAPEAYDCSYVPGKPRWGVTNTKQQTIRLAFTFLVFTLCLLLCVIFVFFDYDSDSTAWYLRYKCDRSSAYWAAPMLLFGYLLSTLRAHALTVQPLRLDKVAGFHAACTQGDFHMCGPLLPEKAPWNHDIGPILYYTLHIAPLVCLLAYPCIRILSWGLFLGHIGSRQTGANESTPLV